MEMAVFGGVLGKLSRQFYAVFCLGVVLISVVIAQQYYPPCASAADDDDEFSGGGRREPAKRRLRDLRGTPLRRRPIQSY